MKRGSGMRMGPGGVHKRPSDTLSLTRDVRENRRDTTGCPKRLRSSRRVLETFLKSFSIKTNSNYPKIRKILDWIPDAASATPEAGHNSSECPERFGDW